MYLMLLPFLFSYHNVSLYREFPYKRFATAEKLSGLSVFTGCFCCFSPYFIPKPFYHVLFHPPLLCYGSFTLTDAPVVSLWYTVKSISTTLCSWPWTLQMIDSPLREICNQLKKETKERMLTWQYTHRIIRGQQLQHTPVQTVLFPKHYTSVLWYVPRLAYKKLPDTMQLH